MTVIPVRLGLQQRVFPEYRAPFFNLLAKSCLQGFSLFAGDPRPEEAIHTAPGLQNGDFQTAHNLHISSGKTYALYQQGILQWLERWQPNVLIVEANTRYLSTPTAIQWMHRRGHPVIGWGLGAPPAGKVESVLRRNFLNSLDAVIAYSKTGAEQYAACGLSAQRVFVAANAVAHRPTQTAPQRSNAYKTGKPNLLFVGRLQERKNLDLLLQACAALPDKLTPSLTIVGDGPDRARLEILAKTVFPSARFTGAKHGAELDPYFNQADLFVLPGTGGLAIQQAMAHALPVIVGQADGTQGELVRPKNGMVLPAANPETLTAALISTLSDIAKLRAMGLASYRIVSEEVNLESMLDSFAKAIKSVL
jgi:glycosyltransferase involved in cell wall biosynthesis